MAEGDTRWVAIEFRFVAERIEGRLYDANGDRSGRPFSGWMGLMAAIDATRFARPALREQEVEVR
jgi:hypothetical protein